MRRRTFVQQAALLGAVAGRPTAVRAAADGDVTAERIPRWRGFNLQGRFGWPGHPYEGTAYEEADFEAMAEWGFDFARLPLSYWTWGSRDDWSLFREEPLRHVDNALELGRQYGVHVNLCFHRLPGYCISGRELEPADLFSGRRAERQRALAAAVFHWQAFARRYRGIPNRRLSFDLLNEPPRMRSYEGYLEERYEEIVRALVAGIREVDPGRLIFADGLDIGQAPVPGIVDLGLVQSSRGYQPKAVSHYTADWVPRDEFETMRAPCWPLVDDQGRTWDRARLKAEMIDRWQPVVGRGVQVHVGEFGCFNRTPHPVALAWLGDCLDLWQQAGRGFALWNLRGPFGVLDSERADVAYEDYKGRQLDRRMLELLLRH
ncbi:MAG TPA: cellulase family glycosylhydrolase [Vicinamibacteria bacterium]|nr:cellulase family glycosylhydrolase [Vicinamibacteria bacterium]